MRTFIFFEKYSEKVDVDIWSCFSKFSCGGVYETRNFDHQIFQKVKEGGTFLRKFKEIKEMQEIKNSLKPGITF